MNNVEREMRFEIAFMTEDIKDLQKREHVEKNFVKRFFLKSKKKKLEKKLESYKETLEFIRNGYK